MFLILAACQFVPFSTLQVGSNNDPSNSANNSSSEQLNNPLSGASDTTEDVQQSQPLKASASLLYLAKPLDFKAISEACEAKTSKITYDSGTSGWKFLGTNDQLDTTQIAELLEIYVYNRGDSTQHILSFSVTGDLLLWDVDSGKAYRLFSINQEFETFAISNDFCFLAIAQRDLVSVYELATGALIKENNRVKGVINKLEFQPNAQSLLVGAADTKIYRWHFLPRTYVGVTKNLLELERYIAHSNVISALRYHPGGRIFFSGDWNGAINAWKAYDIDAFHGRYDSRDDSRSVFTDSVSRKKASRSGKDSVEHLVVSKDGKLLLVGFHSGNVEIWKVRGMKMLFSGQLHKGVLYDLDLNPDSERVVSVGRDGFLRVWKILEKSNDTVTIKQGQLGLEKEQEVVVKDVRVLKFLSENSFVAGAEAGQVYTIAINTKEEA